MSDDLDQGQAFEGRGDQAAANAARELVESRRAHSDDNVDRYLKGEYEDAPHVREKSDAAKRAASTNQNSPGLDPRATARELADYRRGRQRQMAGELRDNFGLTPADAAAAGEADPGPEPEHEQQPQQPQQPQPQRADPAADHAQHQAAQHQAAQHQAAHAQHQAALLQAQAQAIMAARYGDIQTLADAQMLAQVDPARFQQMMHDNAACTSALQQQQQQHAEYARQWAEQQDKAFVQACPETADPVRGPQIKQAAFETLKDLGFSEAELAQSWNGGSLRDARVQRLVRDAAMFRLAVAAARKPNGDRPIPSVQRPGMGRPRGADIQDDGGAFDGKRGGVRAATRLLLARRNAE